MNKEFMSRAEERRVKHQLRERNVFGGARKTKRYNFKVMLGKKQVLSVVAEKDGLRYNIVETIKMGEGIEMLRPTDLKEIQRLIVTGQADEGHVATFYKLWDQNNGTEENPRWVTRRAPLEVSQA